MWIVLPDIYMSDVLPISGENHLIDFPVNTGEVPLTDVQH
jgi:hypothetical protein